MTLRGGALRVLDKMYSQSAIRLLDNSRKMVMPRANTLFVLLLTLFPATALGWGNDGHKIVCEIAFQNLSPAAKRMTISLVESSSHQRFRDTCTWADGVRSDRPETAGWHFVNVPPDRPRVVENRDCGRSRRCAIWAIRRFQRVLASNTSSVSERREALFFLAHFVGDIHQPLHVSHSLDRGGNRIKVNFLGQPSNLHQVWILAS